jgi:hypothetical protein
MRCALFSVLMFTAVAFGVGLARGLQHDAAQGYGPRWHAWGGLGVRRAARPAGADGRPARRGLRRVRGGIALAAAGWAAWGEEFSRRGSRGEEAMA